MLKAASAYSKRLFINISGQTPNGTTRASGQTENVLTPLYDAMCGVDNLEKGKEYLLAGNIPFTIPLFLFKCHIQ